MDMPDKILARYLTTGTHGMVCEKEGVYHGRGGLNAEKTVYVRQDLAQSLADALESIAKNTCCEGCQEAAKVAQAALANYRKGENAPAIEKASGG